MRRATLADRPAPIRRRSPPGAAGATSVSGPGQKASASRSAASRQTAPRAAPRHIGDMGDQRIEGRAALGVVNARDGRGAASRRRRGHRPSRSGRRRARPPAKSRPPARNGRRRRPAAGRCGHGLATAIGRRRNGDMRGAQRLRPAFAQIAEIVVARRRCASRPRVATRRAAAARCRSAGRPKDWSGSSNPSRSGRSSARRIYRSRNCTARSRIGLPYLCSPICR